MNSKVAVCELNTVTKITQIFIFLNIVIRDVLCLYLLTMIYKQDLNNQQPSPLQVIKYIFRSEYTESGKSWM